MALTAWSTSLGRAEPICEGQTHRVTQASLENQGLARVKERLSETPRESTGLVKHSWSGGLSSPFASLHNGTGAGALLTVALHSRPHYAWTLFLTLVGFWVWFFLFVFLFGDGVLLCGPDCYSQV